MTKFLNGVLFVSIGLMGEAAGSVITLATHAGYELPIITAALASLMFLLGPRVEVWLIERGWISCEKSG